MKTGVVGAGSKLRVRLFGRFSIDRNDHPLPGFESSKVQELLSYLLLYRQRAHAREILADRLWKDSSSLHTRKYLRNAIWQLQSALESGASHPMSNFLFVEPGWVNVNLDAELWVDVATFERAASLAHGVAGQALHVDSASALKFAVQLYTGDLLEGWYHDWCLYERERLQLTYLAMLDKLMDYCDEQGDYEAGVGYGASSLRYDRAREVTHRRLMRLHYHSGNRVAALRQYDRCVLALKEELDVPPAKRTTILYQQMRADELEESRVGGKAGPAGPPRPPATDIRSRLEQLQTTLKETQGEVQQALQVLETL